MDWKVRVRVSGEGCARDQREVDTEIVLTKPTQLRVSHTDPFGGL